MQQKDANSELFTPWRVYTRGAWAALAGSVISVGCGIAEPFALMPAALLAATAVTLFWLAGRPLIAVNEATLDVGTRRIAWQEFCEIKQVCTSPLILKLRLTNDRRRLLVLPGEPSRNFELIHEIRSRAKKASYDGVPYRDFVVWQKMSDREADQLGLKEPVKVVSDEEANEIEQLFQTLKTSGKLEEPPKRDRSTSGQDRR